MSINSTLLTALKPIVSVVVPQILQINPGETPPAEYITFNYSEYPLEYADNAPQTIGYSIQVHYFCPLKKNPQKIKDNIQNSLFVAGFSYPQIQDVTDADGQHYVFLCTFEEVI